MTLDWLDILTTILGLIYIWLEYRAHIALWVIGIVMPLLDIYLYWTHGLYGDAGMASTILLLPATDSTYGNSRRPERRKSRCQSSLCLATSICLPCYFS